MTDAATDTTLPDASARSSKPFQNVRSSADRISKLLGLLLVLGIALRLAVLLSAGPFNPDRHFEVIEYVAAHRALPTSNLLDQSYQPPLYYVLLTPLLWLSGGPGLIHVASFALSVGNLWWIRRLLDHPLLREWTGSGGAGALTRVAGFALLATLPQFIMFSSFISNDALALLIGTSIFAAWLGYVRSPGWRPLVWLGIAVGFGLLTKGTFLLSGVALAIGLLFVLRSTATSGRRRAAVVATFCCIWIVLGAYKYVENTQRLGRPIVHNQDHVNPTSLAMQNTWKGPETIYNIDVWSLVRRPVVRAYDPGSYPQLLYGTFWYAHFVESTYDGNLTGYGWVGSVMYLLGIVPSIVFLVGVAGGVAMLFRIVTRKVDTACPHDLVLIGATLLFLSNFAIVMAAGVKYQNWSSFQARLCFQSALPMLVLLWTGMTILRDFRPLRWLYWLSIATCFACAASGVMYFAVEVALTYGLLPSGEPIEWWKPPA